MSRHKPPTKSTQTNNSQDTKQVVQVTTEWAGVLPPPGALRDFDQIVPGGAERIFLMTEEEQAHRIKSEEMALNANIELNQKEQAIKHSGLRFGVSVAALSLVCCVISIWLHADPVVSGALVSIPVLGMVQALVNANRENDAKTNKSDK